MENKLIKENGFWITISKEKIDLHNFDITSKT